MGGDHSQKLLPWRGIRLLSGAQTSGLQQNQHSNPNCAWGLRGTTAPSQSVWLGFS